MSSFEDFFLSYMSSAFGIFRYLRNYCDMPEDIPGSCLRSAQFNIVTVCGWQLCSPPMYDIGFLNS